MKPTKVDRDYKEVFTMGKPSNVVSILNPTIAIDQSIYEESSDQKARLGTRLQLGDRVFRYARLSASANVNAGEVLCRPVTSASHMSAILTVSAATTGATTVNVTASAAMTANEYTEGYLSIASSALAGGGLMFRVKQQDTGTGVGMAIKLYDPIPGSIGAGPADLIPNPYNKVKVDSKVTGVPAGVAPIDVTTSNYFWLQTYGPCSARGSIALSGGHPLILGTAGGFVTYVAPGASSGARIIGQQPTVISVATQSNPIELLITP